MLLLSPILFLQTVVDTADKDGSFGGFVVLLCLFEPIKIPEDRLEDGYAHDHNITSAIFFGFRLGGNSAEFLLAYFLVMLSVYSIGMLAASISPNMKAAELICSLLYFPMLILSGATLPYEIMPEVMQKICDVLPLTQGIKLLKGASLGLPAENIFVPVIVMITLAVVCIGLSIRFFRWE